MKAFPLDQLDTLEDKQVLSAVAGSLKACYPQKSGTSAKGEWSIQNAVLAGSDGTEISLFLKDREEIPSDWRGRNVIIQAKKSDKGLSGIYVFDDEYQGEVRRKLRITPTANVALMDDTAPQQDAEPQQKNSGGRTPEFEKRVREAEESWGPEPSAQSAPSPKHAENEAHKKLREARATVMQIANLHLLCAKAVNAYEAPRIKSITGLEMSETQRQGATGSIFIEACRSGLVRNMPDHPIEEE